MRLNWFSPLPPARTDVAHFTQRLAPALTTRFEVVFWSDTPADAAALPPGAVIRPLDPAAPMDRELRRELFSGLNIYNLGNDVRFHRAIAAVARRAPGVVIAHDTRLHHFAFEQARDDHPQFAGYLALAAELYGEAGAARARE